MRWAKYYEDKLLRPELDSTLAYMIMDIVKRRKASVPCVSSLCLINNSLIFPHLTLTLLAIWPIITGEFTIFGKLA